MSPCFARSIFLSVTTRLNTSKVKQTLFSQVQVRRVRVRPANAVSPSVEIHLVSRHGRYDRLPLRSLISSLISLPIWNRQAEESCIRIRIISNLSHASSFLPLLCHSFFRTINRCRSVGRTNDHPADVDNYFEQVERRWSLFVPRSQRAIKLSSDRQSFFEVARTTRCRRKGENLFVLDGKKLLERRLEKEGNGAYCWDTPDPVQP